MDEMDEVGMETETGEITEQQPCIQMRWSGTTYKFIFFQCRRYVRMEIAQIAHVRQR